MTFSVTGVSKLHDGKWLFRDVDLEAAERSVTCIFSDNADTARHLLDVLSGASRPNGGNVDPGSFRLKQLVPGETNGRRFLGFRLIRDRASDPLATLLKMTDEAKENDLLFFHQPFAGRNVMERERLSKAIKTANEKGASIVFTTADFKDALEFSANTLVLLGGNAEQFAPPQDIYERPASLAVARSVGRNNLIEARRLTSSKSDAPEFVTINGEHRLFAQKTDKNALGAINRNIFLAIRPEQISISFGASFPEDNLLKAAVASVRPMGPTTRVTLNCSGLFLEALVLRLVGLNIGDECMVGLPPDRLQILAG